MASQEILLSTCDRCTAEVQSPLDRKSKKKGTLLLPSGWLHVSGNTATSLVFELDLCEECKQIVMEVAGKAKTVHTTSSKASQKPERKKKEAPASDGDSTTTDEPGKVEPLKLVQNG